MAPAARTTLPVAFRHPVFAFLFLFPVPMHFDVVSSFSGHLLLKAEIRTYSALLLNVLSPFVAIESLSWIVDS